MCRGVTGLGVGGIKGAAGSVTLLGNEDGWGGRTDTEVSRGSVALGWVQDEQPGKTASHGSIAHVRVSAGGR